MKLSMSFTSERPDGQTIMLYAMPESAILLLLQTKPAIFANYTQRNPFMPD